MTETNYDTVFGRMVLEQGFCTDRELRHSVELLKERSKEDPIILQDLMVQLGYITKNQATRVKQNIKESKAAAQKIPGYKILGKLGSGAMAVVYKAEQLSLNRPVAIKVLPKRFTENPEYVERFYKEGKAAAKLNHNNIVGAYDVGEAGGYHYFVMEYVEGKTIHDDLAAGHVFAEPEAVEIAIQVARALHHAHSKGLIHRDVKPKNIMINSANIVKLADMGLARETTDIEAAKTEKGKAYGTPYYIAPEQIRGEIDIDGRADIYGLGATLYHMVTGKVPFMAEDPADVMRMHLRNELVPPDHINTSLSSGISEVIEVMMAKNKEDRYVDAEELLQDLEAIKNGQTPIRAHERYDIEDLEKLEEGQEIEFGPESATPGYPDERLTYYRIAIIALSAALFICLLIIIIMAF